MVIARTWEQRAFVTTARYISICQKHER